jgi:hypothetical protein
MALSEGFRVIVPTLLLDGEEETIVAMQTIGAEQSVNANWAAIVNGGAVNYINSVLTKLSGMKEHTRLKGKLPCGWTENWLLHDQASVINMDTGHHFFYVIDQDEDEESFMARFFTMLDKSLPIPMLPAWKKLLWRGGTDEKLITPLDGAAAINMAGWKVERNVEVWEQIVSTGIKNGALSF